MESAGLVCNVVDLQLTHEMRQGLAAGLWPTHQLCEQQTIMCHTELRAIGLKVLKF
jgi:hypothetical protein